MTTCKSELKRLAVQNPNKADIVYWDAEDELKTLKNKIKELEDEIDRLNFLIVPDKRNGWRQCAIGQRSTQFCGQLNAAVLAERESCANVCADLSAKLFSHKGSAKWSGYVEGMCDGTDECADAIRARGNKP